MKSTRSFFGVRERVPRFIPWLVAVLLLLGLTWALAAYVVPQLAAQILENSGKCESGDILKTECGQLLAALGATGDIFGAVTAMFSGLALLAVAITLQAETKSRKESRKPLVVTYLTADSVYLDQPCYDSGRRIRLTVDPKIFNQSGEPALNVCVSMVISAASITTNVFKRYLELPLPYESKDADGEDIRSDQILRDPILQSLLHSLTQDSEHVCLKIETSYESLEGVGWVTSVTYLLRCDNVDGRQRLSSFRSNLDDFDEQWKNNTAVSLSAQVEPGSWKHCKSAMPRS